MPNADYAWVELGEGFQGDYDPTDPDDVELLRLDYVVDGEEVESLCTRMPVSLTGPQRQQALDVIRAFAASHPDWSPRKVTELFSWMEPEWLTDESLLTNAAIAMTYPAQNDRSEDHA